MRALASGNMREAASLCLEGLRQEIFGELQGKERMAGRLLALGLFGALFAGFSEVFSGGHMAETGFFLTYLMAFCAFGSGVSGKRGGCGPDFRQPDPVYEGTASFLFHCSSVVRRGTFLPRPGTRRPCF